MNENVIIPTYSQSRVCYHTDICRKVWEISDKKYLPKSEADKMRIEECAYCSGEYTQKNGNQSLYRKAVEYGKANDD